MRIALHDADNVGGRRNKKIFPNLALLKISAWHKSKGDEVVWFNPAEEYDKVYSSKVFIFTPEDASLPENAIKGGAGYGNFDCLPDEIEHICPDYDLYPQDFSQGFTTRGCIRSCPWCIVPKKEGKIRGHADVEEFLRHKRVVLMDNNPLACDHGINQMDKLIRLRVGVDYNQALDARLVDDQIAERLAKLKWRPCLRFACDTSAMMPHIQKAVEKIRRFGYRGHPTVYCLAKDVPDTYERVMFLRGLGCDPFVMPYRDLTTNEPAPRDVRRLARWVNLKALFKAMSWEDYQRDRGDRI